MSTNKTTKKGARSAEQAHHPYDSFRRLDELLTLRSRAQATIEGSPAIASATVDPLRP